MLSIKDKEAIWNARNEDIDTIFNSLNKPYRFKYSYEGNYKQIETYIKRLVISSNMYNGNNEFYKYVTYIEDFFCYSLKEGFITPYNINRILTILKKDFKILKFLPEHLRGLYGRSLGEMIEINPNLGDKRSTLYMIHEIGHKIIKAHEWDVILNYNNSFKDVLEEKGLYSSYIKYPNESIFYGFQMIEEALTQELGEILTSKIFNYKRLPMREKSDLGVSFKTNFDYYGLFQELTIAFGKTLRGVGGSTKEESIILSDMLKKAFNTKDSLTLDIIKEYNDGDGNLYLKLYYMLAHMGNFLNEKYASLGLRCFDKMNTTLNNSKAIILKYAKECYDRRPEPASGFPDVKFKKK